MNQKLLNKLFSFIASLSLLVNSLSAPIAVYAQEASDSVTTEINQETQTPTPTPTVTATPVATEIPTPAVEATTTADQTQTAAVSVNTTTEEEAQVAQPTPSPMPEMDLSQTQEDTSAKLVPTISTNQADYSPTGTVLISGQDFSPNTEYTIEITSDTGNFKFSDTVTSDESGGLFYSYQLDGTYRPDYKVEIKDASGNVVATTSFTDTPIAASDVNKLEQWETVPSGSWITGNLGTSNSNYKEGETIPFSLGLKNLPAVGNPYTFSICRDYQDGTKFGYLLLAPYNTTKSPSLPGVITSTNGPFSAIGIQIASYTEVGGQGGCSAGERETQVTLTSTGSAAAYVLWGGRLAAPSDVGVGAGNGAASYSGASLHMSLLSPNKDVSINPDAIIELATITVQKIVDTGSATPNQWGFNISPNPNSESLPKYIQTGQNSITFIGLPTGSYQITETSVTGYSFASGGGTNCTFTGSTGTAAVTAATTAVNATCIFHNAQNTGTIIVHKDVQGPNGADITDTSQNFTVRLDGSDPRTITDNGTVSYSNVPTGSHTITETVIPTGYSFYSFSPDSDTGTAGAQVSVTNGGTTNVYVVNRQNNATVTIHKNVLNPDGSEVSDTRSFTVQRGGSDNKPIAEDTNAVYSVAPGTYTFTELSDINYTLYSITGDNDSNASNGATLTVGPGDSTELTFVNKQKKATINVYKDVVKPGGQAVDDNHPFTAQLNGANNQIFSENSPTFYSVNPGSFTVTEVADSDYDSQGCKLPTGGDATSFAVSSNQTINVTCTNKQKTATITVVKNVVNYNGDDVADDYTFGVTLDSILKFFGEGNNAVFTVDPGTYGATESAETNYTEFSNDGPATVGSNGSATITIVNKQNAGSISGYKYDPSQNGLPDWTIELYTCATNFVECVFSTKTTTDSNGYYSFTNLVADLYQVKEFLNNGWTNLTSLFLNVTINPGDNSTGNNFTNFKLGEITACKYIDANGDGNLDVGDDNPLSGIDIKLSKYIISDWVLQDTKATLENGCVVFEGLTAGQYRVEEDYSDPDLAGYYSSNSITHYDYTISSGSDFEATFLNALYRSISGKKYEDLNGNGLKDLGELGLEGWTIYIDNNFNGVLDGGDISRTTDADGNYEFTNLASDLYRIREVVSTGWTQTEPTSGYYDVDVLIDLTSTGNDFGNFKLASIGDFIWQDNNGDGAQDVGEPGIAGIDVNLYKDDGDGIFELGTDDVLVGTGTTDATGGYLFVDLGPGKYWVDVVDSTLPAGYANTTPDPVGPIFLSSGEIYLLADVGYVPPAKEIVITKSNDKTSASAGDMVTYTLVVSNIGNIGMYVTAIDAIPGGFSYVDNSAKVDGTDQNPDTSVPGILSWDVGFIPAGESVTITYQTKIDFDLTAGTYKNLATCKGVLGRAVEEDFRDGVLSFFGLDQEPVECKVADSSVTIGQGYSYGGQLTPQVLGAATELPATGSATSLLVFALVVGGFGIITKLGAKRLERKKYAKN